MSQTTYADRAKDTSPDPRGYDHVAPGRSSASAVLQKREEPSDSGIVQRKAAVESAAAPAPETGGGGGGTVAATTSPGIGAAGADDTIARAVSARATHLVALHEHQHAVAQAGENSVAPLTTSGAAGTSSPETAEHKVDPTPPSAAPAPAPTAPVQKKAGGEAMDPETTKSLAAEGVQNGGGTLPHLDKIQQSFGKHDVTDVRAHTGAAAQQATAQMGASAYAMGSNIAFRGSADLHTTAHEAAHVVQQRKGVRPDGGVGREGDAYEQHADQVADAVVSGDSAEQLLDAPPGAGAGGEAVQLEMDTTPPSSIIGVDIADQYTTRPALASMPVTEGATGITAEPKPIPVHQSGESKTFFGAARGLDSSMLSNINESRMILDVNIALKGNAIDTALAQDRARGVMLDPGLETAINTYKNASSLAKAGVLELVGLRGQVESLTEQLVAEANIAKTAQDKKDTEDAAKKDQTAEAAAIAKSRREIKLYGDAAIDTVRILTKVSLNPVSQGPGAVIDMVGVAAKVGFQSWNDGQQEAEIAASAKRVQAKWQSAIERVTGANAAALEAKATAMKAQITAIGIQAKGTLARTVAAMKLATESMATIMKSKSSVTALAKIQDFLSTVTPKADALNKRLAIARASFAWDHAGAGATVLSEINGDVAQAEWMRSKWDSRKDKNLPKSMQGPGGMAAKDAEFTAWVKQAKALSKWVATTTAWFAKNDAEITAQAAFQPFERAEKALAAIADLGEKGK